MVDHIQIPGGWRIEKLGNAVRMLSGGTPNRAITTYWNGSIPWLSAKDLKKFRLSDSIEKVTEEGAQNGTCLVPSGTILILVRGMTLHKDVPLGVTTRPVTFNQDVKALKVDSSINSEYLASFLISRKQELLSLVDQSGHGTGRLPMELLKEVNVILPPLNEQNNIVKILDSWGDSIDNVSNLLTLKKKYKVGLMQHLVTGKRRLTEFTTEHWNTYFLGQLFVERVEVNCPDLPLLSITSDRGVIYRDEVDKRDTSSKDKSKYKRIARGDIGYNTMRMWQGVSALSTLEGIVSPAYTVCIPKPAIHAQFAKHLFKFPPIVHLFYRYSQGLVDDTLNLKFPEFASIKVTIPGIEEQQHIAAVLDTIDREIGLLERKLDALKRQKKALMQKLLTGQIRVEV